MTLEELRQNVVIKSDQRVFVYCEPEDPLNNNWKPVLQVISEDRIIAEYWDYWRERMITAQLLTEITRENCIEDFVCVHWAEELTAATVDSPRSSLPPQGS